MNNKGADQTAQMRRLICAFAVHIWHHIFSWPGSYVIEESELLYEPHHEKTCLQGLRPGKTQTNLLSWWDQLGSWNSATASRGIILSRQQTAKVLIRLRRSAGWSAPLLFAYGINRFSHDMAHILRTLFSYHGSFSIWATSRENLFSGYVTRWDSTHPAQL